MGWELIGGDPAPGSPEAVAAAAAALRQVADLADNARADLVAQNGAAGVARWKGTAADAFRNDVQAFPGRLDDVNRSFRDAAGALATFRDTLEQAQADARAALAEAQQAQSDRNSARSRLQSAQAELDALNGRHRSAQLRLTGLQTQQTLALDPAQRTGLAAPIAATRTQVGRLHGDIGAAEQTVGRYTQATSDAQDRLTRAAARADRIRRTLTAAADRAVSVLRAAQREANLPGWVQQQQAAVAGWIVDNGPRVAGVLQVVQAVLAMAAPFTGPAAPVLLGISLGAGVAAFALSAAAYAMSPEGLTRDRMIDLGLQLVSLGAGGAALVAAKAGKAALAARGLAQSRLAGQAARWAAIGSTVETAEAGLRVAAGFAKDGVGGAGTAAGGYLLGRQAGAWTARGLRQAVAGLNKSPTVSSALTAMSRSLAAQNPSRTGLDVPLDGLPTSRLGQTLLGSGRIADAGYLPGNQAARAGDSVLDHALTDQEWNAQAGDAATRLTAELAKQAEESRLGQATADRLNQGADLLGADVEIDLNPSPWGRP